VEMAWGGTNGQRDALTNSKKEKHYFSFDVG
jgi:hypothetical protein